MESPAIEPSSRPIRRGVVAVIQRQQRLLVIRRSLTVAAPGRLCFPGGGIELGESEEEALVRELQEELEIAVEPGERLWSNLTRWNVLLVWWSARLAADVVPIPNPLEVSEVHWLTVDELRTSADLLEGNHSFLDALATGLILLPEI